MTQLKKLRSVLAVKNLQASVDFFCNTMDFTKHLEVDGWCFLSRDGIELMLGHCPDEKSASQIGDHSYFAYIEVDEIDKLHGEFVSRGLTSLSTPESKSWGMREFIVTTPDGHRMMFGQATEHSL